MRAKRMWQRDDNAEATKDHRPEPWSVIRERLDHRLIGAYCALRFDAWPVDRVLRELDLGEEELEPAIRRGAESP